MSAKTFIRRSAWKAVAYSLFCLGSFTVASPSFAVSIDLSTFDRSGDVGNVSPSQATLTNAFPGDDGATNRNVSGTTPVDPFQLETFLGVSPGTLDTALGTTVAEGSAIKITSNFQAGDVFSFNSNFQTFDSPNFDRAFVTIVNPMMSSVNPLTLGNSSFSFTFPTAANYTVGIGVVDGNNDVTASSVLQASNANLQPVPEPLTILGSLTALGFGADMRRRFGKKKSSLGES